MNLTLSRIDPYHLNNDRKRKAFDALLLFNIPYFSTHSVRITAH